jgi:hypothetical protein
VMLLSERKAVCHDFLYTLNSLNCAS